MAFASPASVSSWRRPSIPAPVAAETTSIRGPAMPSASRRARRSSATIRASASARRSALLKTKRRRSACGARLRQYSCSRASSYFSGSTTQVTASIRGRSASTMARCSTCAESTSGRSRIATSSSPSPSCSTTVVTFSQSSSGASSARWRAGTHATGESVVGRVARAGLTSVPARALRTEDFPTPVPPASAMR